MNKGLKITALIIISSIILIGIVMTFCVGFNIDLIYSKNKQITITIGKEFEINDIKSIVKEVTNTDEMIVETVELYRDTVNIKLADLNEEQVEQINQKINEKYELENKAEDIAIIENSNVRLRDLFGKYIYPVSLSVVLIVVFIIAYMLIKAKMGYKLNIIKYLSKFIIDIVSIQGLYFSLVVITRTPFGRGVIPVSLAIFAVSALRFMLDLEKEYKKLEAEKN